jgi:hypothetical protein
MNHTNRMNRMTNNGEDNGETHSNQTTLDQPAVPAPLDGPTTGGEKNNQKVKKASRLSAQKTIIYSQNIQGSGINKQLDTRPYKFEYIILLMEKDKIDAYLYQETWIPDDWMKIINGDYVFNNGTKEDEDPPTPRRGHTWGGEAILLSPIATVAWKAAAGQPDLIKSGMILGCARYTISCTS